MKQSIKIVTIRLNKSGWEKGDLVKQNSSNISFTIARYNNDIKDNSVYTPQQLLVLSDDDIQRNDSFYHSVCNKVFKATSEDVARIKLIKPNYYARKVIASYPQLEGTQPISKETIQQWIDIGTPGEGNVEIIHKCTGRNTIGTTPSGEPIKMNSFIETLNLDSQGNLILEFNRPLEEVMDSVFSKWEATDKIVNDFLESKVKEKTYTQHEFLSELKKVPSEQRKQWAETNKHLIKHVSTYEKINNMASDYAVEKCRIMKNIKCLTARKTAYIDGYKQALKDLGYE